VQLAVTNPAGAAGEPGMLRAEKAVGADEMRQPAVIVSETWNVVIRVPASAGVATAAAAHGMSTNHTKSSTPDAACRLLLNDILLATDTIPDRQSSRLSAASKNKSTDNLVKREK